MRTRTLVLAIAAALLVGAAPAQAHGSHHGNGHHKRHKPRAVDVQLLSINDFHGNLAPPGTLTLPGGVRTPAGGAEYLATHINDLRKQNPNTLVVSAGDNIGASPLVSGLFHDEPTIEAFNAMGVDISSVGNHEFDEGSGRAAAHAGRRLPPGRRLPGRRRLRRGGLRLPGRQRDRRRHRADALPPLRGPPRRRREGRLHRRRAEGHADDRHPVGRRGPHVRRRGRRDQQVHRRS